MQECQKCFRGLLASWFVGFMACQPLLDYSMPDSSFFGKQSRHMKTVSISKNMKIKISLCGHQLYSQQRGEIL